MATVLIVDDEQVIRHVLRRFLEKRGHLVVEAEDGVDALEKFAEGEVDLAIVDLMMPRMDGFELLRLLPTRFPDTGIIVISGVAKELERASGEFDVLAALGKPFELAELDSTIRRALPEETVDD